MLAAGRKVLLATAAAPSSREARPQGETVEQNRDMLGFGYEAGDLGRHG